MACLIVAISMATLLYAETPVASGALDLNDSSDSTYPSPQFIFSSQTGKPIPFSMGASDVNRRASPTKPIVGPSRRREVLRNQKPRVHQLFPDRPQGLAEILALDRELQSGQQQQHVYSRPKPFKLFGIKVKPSGDESGVGGDSLPQLKSEDKEKLEPDLELKL